MRKLTITRRKTFVGCAGKMKVYIEDKAGDTIIGEEAYRKLGELTNGATETYEITSSSAKVYVIADRISKDWCNDCYQLDEGCQDVNLSGINCFNPLIGNPFRFDGNDSDDVKAMRKVGLKKGILFTLAALVLGIIIGYLGMSALLGGFGAEEKNFSVGEMTITLDDSFQHLYVAGHSGVFSSKKADVIVDRDGFSSNDIYFSTLSAKEYANAVINTNGFTDSSVITDGSLCYFIFSNEGSDGVVYRYYAYTFKSEKAFWLVQFAVSEKNANRLESDIAAWAGSISFE